MRILSYNIHKGIGGRDRLYRFQRVLDVIEAENPDILCLQEVARHSPRSHHDDQPLLLNKYFKPEAELFQQTVQLKRGGYGNLILSRWPLVSKHQISLRWNMKKPRGAQLVVVRTPEGPLHLVNFHLGLADAERQWQIDHLLNHHLFHESGKHCTLLIGDYNDWRNRLHRGLLSDHGFQQVTAPISRFRSFPAYLALSSLDKAFCRGTIFIRHARVVRNYLTRRASDHLPLVIDFHLDQAIYNGHVASK
ncbi:MAG TPA: endonuclease/exonuclease/phosphatase family protein [Pirellulales bacterium]|jgi:endonuclease/exonuclease/phosphatase family metal-dependent hydrolase